jgi:hypothetical protein
MSHTKYRQFGSEFKVFIIIIIIIIIIINMSAFRLNCSKSTRRKRRAPLYFSTVWHVLYNQKKH